VSLDRHLAATEKVEAAPDFAGLSAAQRFDRRLASAFQVLAEEKTEEQRLDSEPNVTDTAGSTNGAAPLTRPAPDTGKDGSDALSG
jgi:hypothetical protein